MTRKTNFEKTLKKRFAVLRKKIKEHLPVLEQKIREFPSLVLGKDKNTWHRRGQIMIIGFAGGVVLFLFVFFRSGSETVYVASNDNVSLTRIDGVEAEDRWVETAERRVLNVEEQYNTVIQQNQKILDKNDDLIKATEDLVREVKSKLDSYQEQFAKIEAETTRNAENYQGQPQGQPLVGDNIDPFPAADATPPVSQAPLPTGQVLPSLVRFELSERTVSEEAELQTPEGLDPKDWLPAGSFAPGVVITGADAKTGVSSQSDPRPVVIRITGPAVTAADAGGITRKTDLTGCTITGEARGDLSSERVYVRLLRMTCLDRGHDLLTEVDVKGFVAGAGQAGVRGPVISREGDFVQQAFIAGALGGFGSTASTALSPAAPAILNGDTTNRESNSAALARAGKSGFAAGIGTAGEKLADYYIERAEQYQPVVSLKGGTSVEIVFLEGAWIDGRKDQ